MAYKYKIPRPAHPPLPFGEIRDATEKEYLSGLVDGEKASDIEERMARALRKNARIDNFIFRMPVIAGRNLPGQLEVDFMVNVGPFMIPVQVDGEFAHKTTTQKQEDEKKDVLIDGYLKKYGARPVVRIPGEKLETQDDADRIVEGLIP